MLTRTKIRALRQSPPDFRLRTAMTLARVTQTQVADAIGLAQSQVSEDAAGKFSAMSLDKARTYADYFGCTIEDLFPAKQGAVA